MTELAVCLALNPHCEIYCMELIFLGVFERLWSTDYGREYATRNTFIWKRYPWCQENTHSNFLHQFWNLSIRSQRGWKLDWRKDIVHLTKSEFCLKTSRQDWLLQRACTITVQLFVVITAVPRPHFSELDVPSIFFPQDWGSSAFACIFRNNCYWLCCNASPIPLAFKLCG